MSFEQKEWKNRLSENPVRRTLTPIDGGTPMIVDVTRSEGTVMQQGDAFNADNMNDLEQRIADGIGGGETIIAPTEQEESENAYAVGNKLIFNGVLYDVISPIAVGNTLVPNVNIKATTVSELINILEDEFTANGNRVYMDYKNGQYGYNTSASRGADTFVPFKQFDIPSSITIIGYCDGFSVRATAPAALCNLYNTLQFSQSGGTYAALDAGGTTIGSVGTYNLASYRGRNMTGIVLWLQDDHGPMNVYLTLSNPIS